MTDHEPRQTPSIEDVAARLKAVQEREATSERAAELRRGNSQGAGLAMRIGIELVVAVGVGCALGWFLDERLKTKPIFLLAFISIGFATGVLNVFRLTKKLDLPQGNFTPPATRDDDDD
jgi:ATP synthase protein I